MAFLPENDKSFKSQSLLGANCPAYRGKLVAGGGGKAIFDGPNLPENGVGSWIRIQALREIGWDLVRSHDTSVVAEGAPRMHGHLPRIFRKHRIVVAPNIRGVTVPGVKTASSRRKSWKGK
jgi:hypothetical protein